jgi:hypothetical protein
LKELRCGGLLPQAVGSEEKLMIHKFKHFHPCVPQFLIIDDLQEISIVKQELPDLNLKLSL